MMLDLACEADGVGLPGPIHLAIGDKAGAILIRICVEHVSNFGHGLPLST